MSSYVIARVANVCVGDKIKEYLLRIDETLTPFDGQWVIHASQPEVVEGAWEGSLVVIEFSDLDRAHEWYASKAYQDILHLRTDVSDSVILFAPGVPRDIAARRRSPRSKRDDSYS